MHVLLYVDNSIYWPETICNYVTCYVIQGQWNKHMQFIHKGQKEQLNKCIHLVNVYQYGEMDGIFGKVMGNIWSAARNGCLSKEVKWLCTKT